MRWGQQRRGNSLASTVTCCDHLQSAFRLPEGELTTPGCCGRVLGNAGFVTAGSTDLSVCDQPVSLQRVPSSVPALVLRGLEGSCRAVASTGSGETEMFPGTAEQGLTQAHPPGDCSCGTAARRAERTPSSSLWFAGCCLFVMWCVKLAWCSGGGTTRGGQNAQY